MRTLFLNPPSFEGFDGGASSRWPATREIESYWYPVWLCYPAGMLPDSKVVDAPPHKISIEQTVEMGKDFELLVLYTSTPGFHVDVKTRSRCIEHEQLEILAHLDGLFNRDLVRRRIHHFAVGQHSRRIAEPHRIPVGLDFTRCRPTRAGATIETFKRRRIQKQCSHAISRGGRDYWPSNSAADPFFRASMEKLLKSMVSSTLPNNRTSATLCSCRGTEMPSWISYFLMKVTFLTIKSGFFTR